MLPIAIDAMGGDRAPGEILAAARQAADAGIPVVLVGPAGLDGVGDLPLIEATILLSASVYIAANFIADAGAIILNPRLRTD